MTSPSPGLPLDNEVIDDEPAQRGGDDTKSIAADETAPVSPEAISGPSNLTNDTSADDIDYTRLLHDDDNDLISMQGPPLERQLSFDVPDTPIIVSKSNSSGLLDKALSPIMEDLEPEEPDTIASIRTLRRSTLIQCIPGRVYETMHGTPCIPIEPDPDNKNG